MGAGVMQEPDAGRQGETGGEGDPAGSRAEREQRGSGSAGWTDAHSQPEQPSGLAGSGRGWLEVRGGRSRPGWRAPLTRPGPPERGLVVCGAAGTPSSRAPRSPAALSPPSPRPSPAEVQQRPGGRRSALCRPAEEVELRERARLLRLHVLQVEAAHQEVLAPDVLRHQVHLPRGGPRPEHGGALPEPPSLRGRLQL